MLGRESVEELERARTCAHAGVPCMSRPESGRACTKQRVRTCEWVAQRADKRAGQADGVRAGWLACARVSGPGGGRVALQVDVRVRKRAGQ
jgi:hypothetical protein